MGEEICKGNFEEAYRLFAINCRMARELGAGKMVIHLWDGLTSDYHFEHIRRTGYQGTFTVEASGLQQDGTVDTQLLNRQFAFIRGAVKKSE